MSKTTIPTGGIADDAVNLTSKVTGTLPSANGGTGATSFTGGITMADQWRITSSFQNSATPIASNWERNDTSFDKIGTGMSESSGVFTFPSTGIYHIIFSSTHYISNAVDRSLSSDIELSTDTGSNFTTIANAASNLHDSDSDSGAHNGMSVIVDVTNATTFKIRSAINVINSNSYTTGNSSRQNTGLTFIRLGDT